RRRGNAAVASVRKIAKSRGARCGQKEWQEIQGVAIGTRPGDCAAEWSSGRRKVSRPFTRIGFRPTSRMLRDYLPVLLQIIVAGLFAVSALVVSVLVGKRGKRPRAKDTAYECGMIPQGERQPRFSIKFYVVAMLFILFDLE